MQLRRNGSGTGLIDPIPLPDLSVVQDALADAEWVLHAANQDLPCLAEIGLAPAGCSTPSWPPGWPACPGSGSAPSSSRCSGYSLEKGHSAADWCTRPLPEEWLVYAALDVEVLVELRDALAAILEEQGKTEWARQEFEAILAAGPPAPKADPWRRTSGVHGLRSRRQLGMLRSLWQARDDLRPPARRRPRPGAARLRDGRRPCRPTRRTEGGAAGAAGLPRPRPTAGWSAPGSARSPAAASCPRTSCRRRAAPATARRR